jgi:predicted nucleotidyltransferase
MLQKQSFGSVETVALDRSSALQRLTLSAEALKRAHPEIVEVRLFGSVARGDQLGTSDADILVVIDEGPRFDPLESAREYLAYFELPIGVDVLVMTRSDVEKRLAEKDPFLSNIWPESLPLG